MKRIFPIFFLLVLASEIRSQILPYLHHTERDRTEVDTSSLQYFFRSGEFYGHARYYFMATDNEGPLTDYYANAFGMGIGYETKAYKGFQIGISGFFINNLLSSDLTKNDPLTGQKSRYELGQFDVLDPERKTDMDRLEDLYLKYSHKKSFIKLGKQHIRSPFINPQDGRMRPTLVEGALFEWANLEKIQIEGGYIYKISPRSTVDWFDIGESIGIFPSGVNPEGKPSRYVGNLHSRYVAYAGMHLHPTKQTHVEIWNQHIDHILNTSLLQAEHSFSLKKTLKIKLAGQYIEQHSIGHGGNHDPALTYVPEGNTARTFGFRVGLVKPEHWTLRLNYNRITRTGMYLNPREWGRDPFFTFMARERNEGFSDAHAFNVNYVHTFKSSGWKSQLSAGYFKLPDVRDFARNKYGMPSYWQVNADVRYLFKDFMKGLEVHFLYVYKGEVGKTYDSYNFVFNKVNMSLYNLILNYHF